MGMAAAVSPMYIAEIAPSHLRGRFVSLNQLTIVIGIVAAQAVNYLVMRSHPLPIDPETGTVTENDPETGDPFAYIPGSSTKLMWLDVKIITRPEDTSDTYIIRTDLQTAEEIAHAQNQGAAFTLVLRPEVDTRDVDRSNYGETTDTLLTRYNFRVPEHIDGTDYPQPIAFPSPFPNEEYLVILEPSPSPDAALIEIPVDPNPDEGDEVPVEETPAP